MSENDSTEKLQAPRFDKFDSKSWFVFVERYKTYKDRRGQADLDACVAYACKELLRIEFGIKELKKGGVETRQPDSSKFEDDLIRRISAGFGPINSFVAQDKFEALRMTVPTLEALRKYNREFVLLRMECQAMLPPARPLVKLYVGGLQPPKIRKRIHAMELDDVEQAMRCAVEYIRQYEALASYLEEAPSAKGRDHTGAASKRHGDQQRKRSESDTSSFNAKSERKASSKDRSDESKNSQGCFTCGKTGHYKKECPNRKQTSETQAAIYAPQGDEAEEEQVTWPLESDYEDGRRSTIGQDYISEEGEAKLCSQSDREPTSGRSRTRKHSKKKHLRAISITPPPNVPSMVVPTEISNVRVHTNALCDTGAMLSVVAPRLIRKHLSLLKQRPATIGEIILATGTTKNVKTEVQLTLRFESGEQMTGWFLVCDNVQGIILGQAHLHTLGITLDLDKLRGSSTNKQTQTKSVREGTGVISLHAADLGEPDQISPDEASPLDEAEEPSSQPTVDADCPFASALSRVLSTFADVFEDNGLEHASKLTPYDIELKSGVEPVSRPPRRQPLCNAEYMDKEIQRLLKLNIIKPSTSAWSSPAFVVRAPGRDPRLVVDYSELNDRITSVSFPLRHQLDILERLRQYKYFGKIDLRASYHQIALSERSQPLTAFSTPKGLYEFTRLPFGIKTAPQFFQKQLATILQPVPNQDNYIDDVVFGGIDEEDFLRTTQALLTTFRAHDVRLKGQKCIFGAQALSFLGHEVTATTIAPSPSRTQGLKDLKEPTTKEKLRSFLGLVNYFRRFVPRFSELAAPLTKLTSKSVSFEWTATHAQAFRALKEAVVASTPLFHIDPSCELVLRTDASQLGLGAVLLQIRNGSEEPITFVSRAFTDREQRWATIEQECFAIYFAIHSLTTYLLGRKFVVECDHRNLAYLKTAQAPKLIRWRLFLQEFDFVIRHIPGKTNIVADTLSRCCAIGTEVEVFMKYHGPITGHCGSEELCRRLKAEGLDFPELEKKAKEFVQSCPVCQKVKQGEVLLPAALTPITAKKPFEELSIDTMGPLKEDKQGFKYILCVVDSFTRYVELIPTKDCTAKSAAIGLLSIFARYGAPMSIRSDQGLQFTAGIIAELLKIFSVQRTLVAAYHPQGNGICERNHKETLVHLRALIKVTDEASWSSLLPLVQRIQNDTFCKAIGMAPSELLFGGMISPLRFAFQQDPQATPQQKSAAEFALSLQAQHEKLLAMAQNKMTSYTQRNERRHPTHIRRFTPGQYVLIENKSTMEHKLKMPWKGPFIIVEKQSDSLYLCQDLTTKKTMQIPADRMKRFFLNDSTDPVEVAAADKDEFPVEAIIDHYCAGSKLASCTFQVRWKNYGPADDSWLPYSEVKKLEALDKYLEAHPNVRLPSK